MIVDDLIARLEKRAATRTVREVRVGLGYTAVQLDDGACGLAFTFFDEVETGCTALDQAGTLSGRMASELAGWARSREKVTAAVGWATLNAMIEAPSNAVEADVRELIQVNPDDVVGMVGYFSPLVGRFREHAAQLHIFEQQPQEDPEVHTAREAPLLLPRCDVVVISATTLINHTLDDLLTHVNKARQRVILGPSTPMAPEIFQKHGVTLLSGIQVVDPEYILRVVSEGGSTRRFGRGAAQRTPGGFMSSSRAAATSSVRIKRGWIPSRPMRARDGRQMTTLPSWRCWLAGVPGTSSCWTSMT